MAYFPFFIDLKEKKGVIIGGGRIAERRVSQLIGFEPDLTVIAPEISDLIQSYDEVHCKFREYQEHDLKDAYFVIAATNDAKINETVYQYCKMHNIFVNVIDAQERCDFIFPALIQRGALVVGVSTQGESPHAALQIRNDIEKIIPENMEEILDYLADIRVMAKRRIADSHTRYQYLREMADLCMRENAVPSKETADAVLSRYIKK